MPTFFGGPPMAGRRRLSGPGICSRRDALSAGFKPAFKSKPAGRMPAPLRRPDTSASMDCDQRMPFGNEVSNLCGRDARLPQRVEKPGCVRRGG